MTSSSRERLYRRGAAGAPLHRRNQTTQAVTSRVGNANHPPTCPLCPDAVGVRARASSRRDEEQTEPKPGDGGDSIKLTHHQIYNVAWDLALVLTARGERCARTSPVRQYRCFITAIQTQLSQV